MPQVSVIVPIYNVEKYVSQCIDSLVSQTCHDIEIILVDDGSPDKCGEVCDRYAALYDTIKVIHQENKGVSMARNVGMDAASGTWIMFVDGDDWVEPNIIEKMLEAVTGVEYDLCFCKLFNDSEKDMSIDCSFDLLISSIETGNILAKEVLSKVQYNCLSSPCAKLYKRIIISDNKLRYVQGLKISEDIIFNLYVFQLASKAAFCSLPLYHYRMSNSSVSNRYNPKAVKANELFLSELYKFAKLYPTDGLSYEYYLSYSLLKLCEITVSNITHKNNLQAFPEKIKQIKKLVASEPYNEAICRGKLSLLPRKHKIGVIVLRCRLYTVFYMICRIRFYIKNRRNQE